MDIASVYLNLASLLGTEIEVEGYQLWGVLYNVEDDRESLRIAFPRYVAQQGLMNVNHALHAAHHWTKMTLRGRLTQNRQGEPLLDPIYSIRYTSKARQVDYQATLTYEGNTVTCVMQADLHVNGTKCLIDEMLLQQTSFASQSMSNTVLLKGFLRAPNWGGNPSALIHGLVADWRDWVRQNCFRALHIFVASPLIFWWNFRHSDLKTALRELRKEGVKFSNSVWIQDEDSKYLGQFLGPLIPGGYSHWQTKNIQYLFAGQLAYLDGSEKYHSDRKHLLKFASLHHVRLNYTITFDRPQDE
jgi:hypothetical protein